MTERDRILAALGGDFPLTLVTSRGVELDLPAKGWDAFSVQRVAAQINQLPETEATDAR